jgi:hypothetical protein
MGSIVTTNELPPKPGPFTSGNGTYLWNEETQNWDYYIWTITQGTVKIDEAIINK